MRRLLICFLALILFVAPVSAVTDEQVGEAIERIKQYLYEQQDEDTGGWDEPLFEPHKRVTPTGQTALVVTALLSAGESFQDPRMERAIGFLRTHPGKGTYTVAQRAHVWAKLPDQYRSRLEHEADWLLNAHDGAQFDYDAPVKYVSNSRTHYGVLGLWEFAKRGGRVPDRFWEDAAAHFIETQNDDGGWGYYTPARKSFPDPRQTKSYGAMVASGVTVLMIAQQEMARDRAKPVPEVSAAIERGVAWLDQHFHADQHPFPEGKMRLSWRHSYYLYAIERVALAGGIQQFNGRDWFRQGAEHIINKIRKDGWVRFDGNKRGQQIIDSAFALMFLARGRVPVWINKMKVPDANWNNHPNDLYFLTRHLSDVREHELNWQVVDIDSDPAGWLNAPVAWLSCDKAIELTDAQKSNLKGYIDRGGLLVANPDGGSSRFSQSIRRLAGELYPDYTMQRLTDEHPMVKMLTDTGGAGAPPVLGLSNGARDLILMPTRDWGMAFQRDDPPGRGVAWRVMTNLYTAVTDHGVVSNRLVSPFVPRQQREQTDAVRVSRAIYDGNWNPEPRAWEPLGDHMFNATGRDIEMIDTPLETIGDSDVALMHIAGVEPALFSPEQLDAIRAYVANGGTVLIETIGGRGEFSIRADAQLRGVMGDAPRPLLPDNPIITGKGLTDAYDNRHVAYRRYSVVTFGMGDQPRLSAYLIDDRPAVIISHEDLSLGALGVRRWGVNGYGVDSARNLLTNILLAADAD